MSIFEKWKSYRQQVLPVDASDVQVSECKRAFYAGAMAFLTLTTAIMSDGDEVTPADEAAIAKIHQELAAFGRAGGL